MLLLLLLLLLLERKIREQAFLLTQRLNPQWFTRFPFKIVFPCFCCSCFVVVVAVVLLLLLLLFCCCCCCCFWKQTLGQAAITQRFARFTFKKVLSMLLLLLLLLLLSKHFMPGRIISVRDKASIMVHIWYCIWELLITLTIIVFSLF